MDKAFFAPSPLNRLFLEMAPCPFQLSLRQNTLGVPFSSVLADQEIDHNDNDPLNLPHLNRNPAPIGHYKTSIASADHTWRRLLACVL